MAAFGAAALLGSMHLPSAGGASKPSPTGTALSAAATRHIAPDLHANSRGNRDEGAGLLGIPDSRMLRCHFVPKDSSVRGARVTFEIGEPTDPVTRNIDVAFDSAGRPLILTDVISTLDRAHGITMRSASARFSGTRIFGFIVVHERHWSSRAEALTSPPEGTIHGNYVALTDSEQRAARALAYWVWTHRCPPSKSKAVGARG